MLLALSSNIKYPKYAQRGKGATRWGNIWGISSFGRASALHAEGERFDPAILHQIKSFFLLLTFTTNVGIRRNSEWKHSLLFEIVD